jgi:hypothetical protein
MTTTAKIAAKGTKGTGITEDLAATLHDNLGKTIVAVVEITAETRSENRKGDETVGLSIGTIEVAPDGMAADHVRELARSFHYERRLAEDGPTLPTPGDDIEPKVADVLAAGKALAPHTFEADPVEPNTCNVCGADDDAPLHGVLDDPFTEPDEE